MIICYNSPFLPTSYYLIKRKYCGMEYIAEKDNVKKAANILEKCSEFAALIPEVRSNIVMAAEGADRVEQVVGIPGRIVQEKRKCAIDLDHGQLPDPVAEVIKLILQRQDELEKEMKDLGISTDIVKINGFLSKKSEIEEIFTEGAGI